MYINNLTIGCNKPNQGKTSITSIAFLGDSITDDTWSSVAPGAYYEPPNPVNHWTRIVARELNVQSYNFGIAGDSAVNIATSPTRINDVIAKHPSHCTLVIGGNDIYGGQTPDQIMANINTIVTALRNTGITVILMWCPISPFGSTVDGNIQDARLVEMVTRYNTYAVANNLKFIDLTKSILCVDCCPVPLYYLPDSVHPNTEGQSIIANYFLKELNVVPENLTYELEKDVTLMVFKADTGGESITLNIPVKSGKDILCMYSGSMTGGPSDKRETNSKIINSTTSADFNLVTSYYSTGRYVCLIKNATNITTSRSSIPTKTQLDYFHVLGNTVQGFSFKYLGIKKINDKALINAVNLNLADSKCAYMFTGNKLTKVPAILKYYPGQITKLPTGMFSYSTTLVDISNLLTDANIVPGSDYFSLTAVFQYCDQITTIPTGFFNNLNVCPKIDFSRVFGGCSKITTIPSDLIPATPSIYSIYTFYNCTGINTAIPDFWNTRPNITVHGSMFEGCTNAPNYNSIPSGWK